MANLRTNNLSGEQGQNAYRGSVFFDGESQLDVTSNSDFAVGTGAYTAELWFHSGLNSGENSLFGTFTASNFGFGMWHNANNLYFEERQNAFSGDNPRIIYDTFEEGHWYHIAMCRDSSSGTLRAYVNGVQIGSTTSNLRTIAGTAPTIGENGAASNQCKGYISNIRFSNTELYPSGTTFTPPTSELTADASTILLACQDSDDPTQEATGKTITAVGGSFQTGNKNILLNGDFSQGTTGFSGDSGASISESGGVMTVTNGGGDNLYALAQAGALRTGGKYRCTATVTPTFASGNPVFRVRFGGDAVSFTQQESTMSTGVAFRLDTGEKVADGTRFEIGSGDSSGITQFTVTDLVVTAIDPPIPVKNIPPFGVDAGNTFGGPIQQSTQGYMYFPTGRTEERGRGRALFLGGNQNPNTPKVMDTIDYVEMRTSGVGVRFGSLTTTCAQSAAFASSTRGINAGGTTSAPGDNQTNIIEFVTIATEGNGTDFGDLDTTHRRLGGSGHSSQTRGIITGGSGDSPGVTNVIQFVTIASIGDATNFGDLLNPKDNMMSKNGSSTRMLICGGRDYTPSATVTNVIEFLTIATTGNSTDFGDLTQARFAGTGCSSATRGVIVGGQTPTYVNTIDFVTIASAGDATDFGDLTATTAYLGGASNSIIGIFAGGATPTKQSSISSIEIATTGNAVAFGDNTATNPVTSRGTCSDSHGGLS